jgi:mannose-6-phosphate isomerase-like protein (cupin superfamily)
MVHMNFDAERDFDEDSFSAQPIFRGERTKFVFYYFESGQFIPVHAPGSDVVIAPQWGSGVVRDGEEEHAVEPGNGVVVTADTDRGIRASDDVRLQALMVVMPPTPDAEHELVRRGLRTDTFDPE